VTTTTENVLQVVSACIADSLAVPLAEVRPGSRLIDDLGADSLDFVDIIFTLERKFGIQMRDTEFNFLTRLDFSSPEVMQNGYLTAAVIDKLAGWLPALGGVADPSKVTPRELFSLISVESIGLVIQRRLGPAPHPGEGHG
jgi:acyl carrier protein